LAAVLTLSCGLYRQSAAAAPILFSTFGPGNSYTMGSPVYGVDGSAEFQAFLFVPTTSGTLGSITVALGRTDVLSTQTQFDLYHGTATSLGSLVETFIVPNTVPRGFSPGAVVQFPSISHPALAAGENYWLSYTEPGPADLSDSLWFQNDQGLLGTRIYKAQPPEQKVLPAFAIEAVPETSTALLVALGLLLTVLARRGVVGY